MEHIYCAGIITYSLNNDTVYYLILRYQAGHWDFPKGKIETGETKQTAALRELKEEAGINAQLDKDFEETINYVFMDHTKQITQKTVYFFVGRTEQTTITLSHEHTDYRWLPFKEALELVTYDNAKKILKKAHKYILTRQ
jgi:bis(5'-nucleosidyl)-tetraphosphatase